MDVNGKTMSDATELRWRNTAAQHIASEPRSVAVLPPELANQIAAGEVVERPASVVKELVENSLDAGARRIEVVIEEGGHDLIRVEDDGCGMRREDALRAFERHATSKITKVDDLFAIVSLGFRGEALPSIASVSRLELQTKPHDDIGGTRIFVEGGVIREVEDVGKAAGTTVIVEELFFNTPARLKFLKTPATETRYITEMLTRMALSRPDVRFKLRKDGKVRLDLPEVDNLKDRILAVMGREVYDDLYPTFEYPAIHGVVARGYFSKPGHSQRSARNVYTFVNGRFVQDRTIRAAIRKSYKRMLERGRHPSVVLFVEVPFSLVDVNVHPAKTEVRFDDTQPIFRAVYHAIADALAEAPWLDDQDKTYSLGERRTFGGGDGQGASTMIQPGQVHVEPLNVRHRKLSQQQRLDPGELNSPFFERHREGNSQVGFSDPGLSPLREPPRIDLGQVGDEVPADGDEGNYFSTLKVIGQYRRAYIVCEDASGLVIIDQHAAHERIAFEYLRQTYAEDHQEKQPMLFPLRLELDALRSDVMQEQLDFFLDAGFEIEHFGGDTYVLKEIPAVLEGAPHEKLITDALDDLSNLGTSSRVEEALDDILSRMACHSVVRGPTNLTIEECEGLLREMDTIDFKGNCPHGRPVYYRIPLMELEKAFDRR